MARFLNETSDKKPLVFIIAFVLLGVVVLAMTRASGPFISLQPESSRHITGAATVCSDPNASNRGCVKFGTANAVTKTIVAAGDIVWPGTNMSRSLATAALVKAANPDAVLPLGDLSYTYNQDFQYDPSVPLPPTDPTKPMCGGLHFASTYYDHWGVFNGFDIKSRTYPAIGNHEYIYEPNSWDGPPPPDPHSPHPTYTCDRTSGKTATDTARPFWHYFGNQINTADPTQQAAGTDGNFNSRKGYYSYTEGSWHMIALNFECSVTSKYNYVPGGCGPGNTATCTGGSPQWNWLCADLKANTKPCILAYAHRPAWSAGQSVNPQPGSSTASPAALAADPYAQMGIDDPAESAAEYTVNKVSGLNSVSSAVAANGLHNLVHLLQNAKADILLAGHIHVYEHLKPISLNASDVPTLDPNGITEFIVGSGGSNMGGLIVDATHGGSSVVANSGLSGKDHGVLKLTLKNGSADYAYMGTSTNTVVDNSTINGPIVCHAK